MIKKDSYNIFHTLEDKVDLLGMKFESKSYPIKLAGYDVSDFDPYFISECEGFIDNLTEIRIEEIKLSELKFVLRLNYGKKIELKKVVSVEDMPVYKFLEGNKNEYIILFNGQNYIRDGQHRAAILAYLNGLDASIPVMRFVFKGKIHYTYPSDNKIFAGLKWISHKILKLFK